MSWEQLLSITREARELQREEEERQLHPVACPYDGTPLEDGPRNERHCRFCGFTPF
jgi:hypothetical protein